MPFALPLAGGIIGGATAGIAGAAAGVGLGALAGGALSDDGSGDLYNAYQAQMAGLHEADMMMADAQVKAAELIAAGQEAAAAATIEAAKLSAKAILESTQMSIDAQERFFAIADKKLTPFINLGGEAGKEMASMLGIPNADGVLIPYDTDKLRQTPGYEFVEETGRLMVEKSAVGQKLSGQQVKDQIDFGQRLADTTFWKQFEGLGKMYQTGANAAGQLANASITAGANIGQSYNQQGTNLANTYNQQGTNLANIYNQGAASQADLIGSLASAQANTAIARSNLTGSLYSTQAQMQNDRRNALLGVGSDILTLGLGKIFS